MVTMAEVMHRFSDAYIKAYPVSLGQLRLINDIKQCRTVALGSHVTACTQCGDIQVHYNSCGNRGCPNCQGVNKEKWILERNYDLLPVQHFHVVFTLPSELRSICWQNQKLIYNLLFTCAWQTIEAFSKDPNQKLQARMGMIAVLHTWSQQLLYHPHVHCIVPAGGISQDGNWKTTRSNGNFLFPVKALAQTFRGKMMEQIVRLYKSRQLKLKGKLKYLMQPGAFWQFKRRLYDSNWVVYAKAPFANPATVLEYLGRYTHRIAISNYRILDMDHQSVTFSYLDRSSGCKKQITLPGAKFIARFLLHVLPKGYCKIRHYGIFATRIKTQLLDPLRVDMNMPTGERPKYTVRDVLLLTKGIDTHLCSACKQGVLVVIEETPGTDQTKPRGSPIRKLSVY